MSLSWNLSLALFLTYGEEAVLLGEMRVRDMFPKEKLTDFIN